MASSSTRAGTLSSSKAFLKQEGKKKKNESLIIISSRSRLSKDAKREIKRNSPDKKGRQSQARDRAITWPKQVFIYLLLFPQTILTFDKRKKKEITYCTLNGGGNPLDPNQTTRNSVYNSPELLYVGRDAGQPVNTVDDPVLFDEFRAAFQHHRNCQIAKQSGTCTRWKKRRKWTYFHVRN